MIKNQIQFYLSGSEVSRYHTVRTIQGETVGHHSHGVAVFCYLLSEQKPSAGLLMSANFHDLAEHVTGDLPSPSKKAYGIGEQVNELENKLLTEVGFELKLSERERRILKLADIYQGLCFSLSEVRLGNSRMQLIADRYSSYAEDMNIVGREREVYNAIWELHNDCE